MTMETITGYRRNQDGTLEIVDLYLGDSGVTDALGFPLTSTDELVELQGWPHGHGRVWVTDGGVEVIIGERSAS